MLCTGWFICIWMLIESVSINEECNGSTFSCKLSWKRVELQESCEVVRKWQEDPWVVRLHRATLRMFRAHLKTYQHSIFVFQGNISFFTNSKQTGWFTFLLFFLKQMPADRTVKDSGTTGTNLYLHCWPEWAGTSRWDPEDKKRNIKKLLC